MKVRRVYTHSSTVKSYPSFVVGFLERYDNRCIRTRLASMLYGLKQSELQPVSVFLRSNGLCLNVYCWICQNRIFQKSCKKTFVRFRILVDRSFDTIEQLVQTAQQIERKILGPRSAPKQCSPSMVPNAKPAPRQQRNPRHIALGPKNPFCRKRRMQV